MIQRIQTVYLFVAAVLSVVCLCLKIGEPTLDGRTVAWVYNLWTIGSDGAYSYLVWPLFAVLLLSVAIGVYAIFGYRNRKAQARMCLFSSMLVVGWYVLYTVYAFMLTPAEGEAHFSMCWPAGLPLVSLLLYILARRAILADERLVRAADRIR